MGIASEILILIGSIESTAARTVQRATSRAGGVNSMAKNDTTD
jgi:hypothetical protein